MSTIIQHSQNKSLLEIEEKASAAASTVVLIISPTDRPSATEMERVRDLMALLRTSYFDVYFAYVATEHTDFQNINNEYLDYSELFLTVSKVVSSKKSRYNVPKWLPNYSSTYNKLALHHTGVLE